MAGVEGHIRHQKLFMSSPALVPGIVQADEQSGGDEHGLLRSFSPRPCDACMDRATSIASPLRRSLRVSWTISINPDPPDGLDGGLDDEVNDCGRIIRDGGIVTEFLDQTSSVEGAAGSAFTSQEENVDGNWSLTSAVQSV